MTKANIPLLAFNRGVMSPLALARTDIPRIGMSAEIQHNWMPLSLGSMSLRSGLGVIGRTRLNRKAVHIEFIRALDDTAIIEITEGLMRVRVNEQIVQRPAVTTAIVNGTFDSSIAGWTILDESGATSSWATGGYLSLEGTRLNAAIVKQVTTVPAGSIGVKHGLRVVVTQGSIMLRVGSTDGTDNLVRETRLGHGTHSIAFTPNGSVFHIQLSNTTKYAALVTSCTIEAAGDLTLPVPWLEADLPYIRWAQSVDVIYVACRGHQQRKIERRGVESWSLTRYVPEDGPFRIINTTSTTLTPGGFNGSITLTASRDLFYSDHVGALFRLSSVGQDIRDNTIAGDDQYSSSIRITGVDATRGFSYLISGTWTGTITLQRSVDDGASWNDVLNYTANVPPTNYDDGFDNQIYLYRLGFKPGNYTSGSADVNLYSASGTVTGIVKITGFIDEQTVQATVLKELGGVQPTSDWYEGEWSDHRGWPSAVVFHEGRLAWVGNDRNIMSITDSYESFNDEVLGDSGLINRSVGGGAVANFNWALSMQRLALGADMAEYIVASSSLDEVLSPTAYNVKSPSSQGSARVAAVKVDNGGFFVQASGARLFSINYDGVSLQYASEDVSKIAPHLFTAGIVKLAVQRQPDTRIHALLANGTVVVLVHDTAENLRCLVTIDTPAGFIEDIVIMPGAVENAVYYTVRRVIDGVTGRFFEKFALESECQGGTLTKLADSFVTYSGAPTVTVTAAHLPNQNVIIWADGQTFLDDDGRPRLFTLNSLGQVTLDAAVSDYVVGLPYSARYRGTKLAYAAQAGTALTQAKRVTHLGLILHNTHARGIYYGKDFDNMDTLPQYADGAPVPANHVWGDFELDATSFKGGWNTDSRLCLQANAPLPCTVLAAIVGLDLNEKV